MRAISGWKPPPSFLGGPVRSTQAAGPAFADIQHPAEATQTPVGKKKGLKGEREQIIQDMKSGAFADGRPAVDLRFRMIDGNWDGDMFCPCCEVVSLDSSESSTQATQGTQARRADDEDPDGDLYCDLSWAAPGAKFDLILSPLLRDLYTHLNLQESASDFTTREFSACQPLFAQPNANAARPILVACAVETADGHAGYTQQGTGQHAHAGQGSYAPPPSAARGRAARFDGAPGSMYPG